MSIRIEWNKLIRDFHSTHQSRCMYTSYVGAMLMFETFSKLCIVCCMLCCCRGRRRRRHRCCTHFRNPNVTYGPNDIYLKWYRWKINNYFVHAPLFTTINSFDTFWMDENVLFTKTNDVSFQKNQFSMELSNINWTVWILQSWRFDKFPLFEFHQMRKCTNISLFLLGHILVGVLLWKS